MRANAVSNKSHAWNQLIAHHLSTIVAVENDKSVFDVGRKEQQLGARRWRGGRIQRRIAAAAAAVTALA